MVQNFVAMEIQPTKENLLELESVYFEVLGGIPERASLAELLARVEEASARGYFSPSDDELLLERYVGHILLTALKAIKAVL